MFLEYYVVVCCVPLMFGDGCAEKCKLCYVHVDLEPFLFV
jgi:hypothetical protein